MKKLLLVLFCLMIPIVSHAETETVAAAGAYYTETRYIPTGYPSMEIVAISYVADAADGSYTATTTTDTYSGYVLMCGHDPNVAGTDNTTDIVFTDVMGFDVCGTTLTNIDTGDNVYDPPLRSAYFNYPLYPSTLTFDVTGNSVNSASGIGYIVLGK